MKQTILLMSFILIVFSLSAQSEDSLSKKRIILYTSVFDFYIPFNLGAEVYVKNHNSVGINFGYVNRNDTELGFIFPQRFSKLTGFRIKADYKHFFKKHKIINPLILVFWPHIFQFKSQNLQNSGYYFGTNFNFEELKLEANNNNQVSHKNVRQLRMIFKSGYQCVKKFGLSLDVSFGFGLQNILTYNNDQNQEPIKFSNQFHHIISIRDYKNFGNIISPVFQYEFKLGCAFGK